MANKDKMNQERKELEQKVVDLANQISQMSREIEAAGRQNNLNKLDNFHIKCILAGLKHAQRSAMDWIGDMQATPQSDETNP